MDLEMLRERARIIQKLRAFFDARGYLEVDTPLMACDLIPESCLDVFETSFHKGTKIEKKWLIPSPEAWMKRLLSRHRVSLYQICHCFRNGESRGGWHNPEFTMLEYYTVNADYRSSLALTETLFNEAFGDEESPLLKKPFERITMEEAFARWAGADLFSGNLGKEARRLGMEPPPGLPEAALFDLIFVHAVEPSLPRDRAVVLTDYPAFVPCLAKKRPDGRTVERWELFLGGMEVANCYSEETGGEETRRFFAAELKAKTAAGQTVHQADPDFWRLPLPPCSGVALGVDRLVMALTGCSSIERVLLGVGE